jgi:hypothetical protein
MKDDEFREDACISTSYYQSTPGTEIALLLEKI